MLKSNALRSLYPAIAIFTQGVEQQTRFCDLASSNEIKSERQRGVNEEFDVALNSPVAHAPSSLFLTQFF